MARKKDVVKKIDIKSKSSGAPLPLVQEDQPAPPAFYVIPAPDTLVLLSQAIQRSTQAPLVMVSIGWQEAPNIAPDYYNVEYSEDIAFSNIQKRRANTTSATIDSLKANNVTYYFRVQAVLGGIYSDYSNTLTVATMTDTTPPPNVTGASAAFEYSNLIISYTIPQSEILKDVEIKIYNVAHSVLYGTFYTTTQKLIWTAEQNIFATGGSPLTQVSVDIRTRSWTNEPSTTTVNVTATAPIPATPVGYSSNWIGDTGRASADFVTAWLSALNADSYDISIDGIPYSTRDTRFVYRYDKNVTDHAPTLPSGSPSFIWLLKSRDKLGQVSVPVNVTVTNAAPPSGVMSLTVLPGFSQIAANVAMLAGEIIQDFDHYEWALLSGATTLRSFISTTPDVIITLSGSGTYGVNVKAVDKFNQKNAGVTVAGITMDVLTIEQLRLDTTYTDSNNNTQATLNILKDDVGWGGANPSITYSVSTSWQWVKAERPLIDRYKQITFGYSQTAGGTLLVYYKFDDTKGNISYAAGPVTILTNGAKTLTTYSTEATAQTNAIDISGSHGTPRYDLTSLVEARAITVFFKATTQPLLLYEYYPRRLVQSDDIEAEGIKTLNLAVGSVIADRISVINLQAVSAQMGALNMDGVISISAAGGIYQGTGSFASPTTGLKLFNSGGVGKLSTYNTAVEQITLDTDGKFKWAAGAGIMDADGIKITVGSAIDPVKAYLFKDGSANTVGGLYGYANGGHPSVELHANSITGKASDVTLQATTSTGFTASLSLRVSSGITNYRAILVSTDGTTNSIVIDALNTNGLISLTSPTKITQSLKVSGLVSVGSSTIAATRALSIFGDNGYLSWNNAAGTEKWVAGLETSSAGRWILYNDAASAYSIIVDTASQVGLSISPSSKLQIHDTGADSQVYVSSVGPRIALGNNSVYGSRTQATRWVMATGNGQFGLTNAGDTWLFTEGQNGGTAGALYLGAALGLDLAIGTGHNVSILNKLMVGSTTTAPTHTLQLINDDGAKTTTTTWTTTSTEKAKDQIKTRKGALARIKQLRLADYITNGKYNTLKDVKGVGFIAEELKQIYPNAVKEVSYTNENGVEESYLVSNPHEIFMDYAVAIQELEEAIAVLQAQIGK